MAASAHVCVCCSENFIVSTKSIICKFCDKYFHPRCISMKETSYRAITECKNVFWYCNGCVTVINDKLDTAKKMDKIEIQVAENRVNTAEILRRLEQTSVSNREKPQWSDIVKRNPSPPLLIRPKQTDQHSNITKQAVIQTINPSELSVEINKCKPVGRGGIVIECGDKESLQKLQDKATTELAENYTVEIPKIANPKVVVVGVQEKYLNNEEEFIRRVKNQSCFADLKDMTVKINRKYIPKNKRLHNIVMELSPDAFKRLIGTGKLYIDWDSFPVYEYVGVLRCYKCWKYGHKAIRCQQPNIVCPNCNKNHKSEDCNSTVKECTNCKHAQEVLKIPNIDYKHSVFDKNCICYMRAVEKAKARINYI